MQELSGNPKESGEDEGRLSVLKNAKDSLEQTCSLLVKKFENSEDPKLAEGVLKFSCKLQRLMKSMNGNLTSALFNFGAAEISKSRNGKKIKVQPNRKRTFGNGSHQAVAKGRPAAFVAFGVTIKRQSKVTVWLSLLHRILMCTGSQARM